MLRMFTELMQWWAAKRAAAALEDERKMTEIKKLREEQKEIEKRCEKVREAFFPVHHKRYGLPDPYVDEVFWHPDTLSPPRRSRDHWSEANADLENMDRLQIEEWIKEQTEGWDPCVVTGQQVLIKRFLPSEKTAGGVITPKAMREAAMKGNVIGQILDWGAGAFRHKRFFPDGRPYYRGDLVLFRNYEHMDIPEAPDGAFGRQLGKEFDLVILFDDKIRCKYKK